MTDGNSLNGRKDGENVNGNTASVTAGGGSFSEVPVTDSAHDMSPTRRIDPATIQFDLQDAVRKLMELMERDQRAIATAIGIRESTVSEFMTRAVNTKDDTVTAILAQLGTTRAEMDALVARMNGHGGPRAPTGRAEDQDPKLRNAIQVGRDIASLPDDAQDAIFHLMRVFERAYRGKLRPVR